MKLSLGASTLMVVVSVTTSASMPGPASAMPQSPHQARWTTPGLLAGSIGDAPGWGPVTTLLDDDSTPLGWEAVVANEDGSATVLWEVSTGLMAADLRDGRLEGATRISGVGHTAVNERSDVPPQLAADARGNVTAVWTETRTEEDGSSVPGWKSRVMTAYRPSGGEWEESKGLGGHGTQPDLAVSPGGVSVATWRDEDGAQIVSAYRPVGGEWQQPQMLQARSALAQVGVGDGGGAVLVFRTSRGKVKASRSQAGGLWRTPTLLQSGGGPPPDLAVNGAGRAVAVWSRPVGHYPTLGAHIYAASRNESGRWSEPERIWGRHRRESGAAPAVAVDRRGRVTVAWTQGFERVMAIRSSAAGDWRRPKVLARGLEDMSPFTFYDDTAKVAVNRRGDALVTWAMRRNGESRLESAYRPIRKQWSPPKRITRRATTPYEVFSTAITRAGGCFVVWRLEPGTRMQVRQLH